MAEKSPFKMTLSLNVLNHLGINLYSNVPAVMAEIVANAWDADAEKVEIEINKKGRYIVITDDGHGMTAADINAKYLHVGYGRRLEPGGAVTPKHKRPVMGRKGIGKLSLFSVADEVEVHSVRTGERNGFKMSAAAIKKALKDNIRSEDYHPEAVEKGAIKIRKGTRIKLTRLKKDIGAAESALRKRLARRFSVIGDAHDFQIYMGGTRITVMDRDYFHKIQYLWEYGSGNDSIGGYCKNKEHSEKRGGGIKAGLKITGWIGSVKEAGALKDGKDNLNKITIMARGKLAQEDILEDFAEGGIYTKYLMGEIHADFLDDDKRADIATSSRQKIIEDDPRYEALKAFLQKEMKYLQGQWTDLRNEQGTDKALEIPAIKEWFSTLSQAHKKHAKSLFGKINQLTIENEEERRGLLKHGVLAFESLRYKDNLEALESVTPQNLHALGEVFGNLDDIEATLYHQIVTERIAVIKALNDKVSANALEKIIQTHLFKHLWLLDPSWERATDSEYMEQNAAKEFASIDAGLTPAERAGRLDIKYKEASGKHIVVELKRADRKLSTLDLLPQIDKYRNALTKLLASADRGGEPVEVVCVVGKDLTDWDTPARREESRRMLEPKNARVITYQKLIQGAYKAYNQFIVKSKEAGRVSQLIKSIDAADLST